MKPMSVIAGISEIILLLGILVLAPTVVADYVHFQSIDVASIVRQVYPASTQLIAMLLAVASGATTILSGHRYRDYAMLLQGICMGVYFYFLLDAGHFALSIIISGLTLKVGALLTLQLSILELAAFARIAQAGFEILGK